MSSVSTHAAGSAVVTGTPVEVRATRTLSVAHRAAPPGSPHAGTVVFFAHGGGGNKNQWRRQWRTFGDAGYGLVAWDFLGHGDSPRPHAGGGAYHGEETLRDYLALFHRYKGTHNVLVAHSLGTGSTLALLERLAGLGRLHEVSGALLLGTQLARPVSRQSPLPGWLLEWIKPVFARRFRRLAWHPDADPALVAYESRIARGNRMTTFQAVLRDAPWPDAARLAALDLPVTVLAGDADGLTPPAGGHALADALPDATFDVLHACGHQLMLEQPDAVNVALLALLERIAHPAASA
ncbi:MULTISPECIES: alpha/beta fold hydrolase [Burkholderia]|uniref:Alpha/beta hydrolase n=1 Tax=Burkholderia aenigmatica TaxID=2015348 RepID=A0A6J5IPN4_9BURK|nr:MULTISPECIES: alpha/beta hydrolase [Burkholderia]CAB3962310.1 alpha/beta hydrolase [Burkholderia aenigmatica]